MLVVQIFSRFNMRSGQSSTTGIIRILHSYGAEVFKQELILVAFIPDFDTFRKIQAHIKTYNGTKQSYTKLLQNPVTKKWEFDSKEQAIQLLTLQ